MRAALRPVAIGLLFFASAALTIRYTRFDGGAACLWIATAILMADLALKPVRSWTGSLLCAGAASIAATAMFGVGAAGAPLIAPFVVGEAALAAVLLRRWNGGKADLGTLRDVWLFVALAGVLAPAASGLGGAAVIATLTGTAFANTWLQWYLGHALGNIAVAPLMLMALGGKMFEDVAVLPLQRKIEGAGLIVLTFAVALLVFGQSRFPLLFLPLLPQTIAAFRFGRLGGATAIVIVAATGVVCTVSGSGPVHLVAGGDNERALFLQFYLSIAVAMTLLIAAELNGRKALVVALRESEARFRLIAEGSSDVILNLSVDGTIEYASPSIRELGGYAPERLIGSNAAWLVAEEDRAQATQAHRDAIANPQRTVTVAYRGVAADGRSIWCETHTRGIADDTGRAVGAVSAIRDISAHKRIEAELWRVAETDPLTGVVNRRGFDAALALRLRDATAGHAAGVCAVFDLDFFKQVNDRHGHAAGDRVLCVFADMVRRSLRAGDVVARLGGEEFAVILWDTDIAEAYAICERLRCEIADLAVATGAESEVRFTFSGGLARIAAGRSAEEVLHDADAALYRAKRTGRNRLELAA